MKYITTALLLLVLSSPAQAGISDSGNELLPACKLALDPPNNESRRQGDDALLAARVAAQITATSLHKLLCARGNRGADCNWYESCPKRDFYLGKLPLAMV